MSDSEEIQAQEDRSGPDLDALLGDPKIKEAIIKKIGLDVPRDQHPTPSGTAMGGWQGPVYPPPAAMWPGVSPYPPFSMAGAGFPPPPAWSEGRGRGWWAGPSTRDYWNQPSTSAAAMEDSEEPGGSSPKRPRLSLEEDEDVVDLLEESEALELIEFDPKVEPEGSWEPPQAMTKFLEKHFNHLLADKEREAILKDFPKPNCIALSTPKLDDQVRDQLKRKGKSPHFGAEKSLYKIQEQLLEVAGPLTCLWADLLNKNAKASPEDILLLTQRALVLLGSTSHAITLERRKVAWSRLNPKLKSLATEEYTERDSNLFGPGFLEKASKRLEAEKAFSKVTSDPKPPQSNKRSRPGVGRFLSRGASIQGGNPRNRQYLPHPQDQFRKGRYFQREPNVRTPKPKPFNKRPDQEKD